MDSSSIAKPTEFGKTIADIPDADIPIHIYLAAEAAGIPAWDAARWWRTGACRKAAA